MGFILLGVTMGKPVVASGEAYIDTQEVWLDANAWADPLTEERWIEYIPVAPMFRKELGDHPFWVHWDPSTETATASPRSLIPDGRRLVRVALDMSLVNTMIGDLVVEEFYSRIGDDAPDGCFVSCYDLRKASDIYRNLEDALTDAGQAAGVQAGLIGIGSATVGFAASGFLVVTALGPTGATTTTTALALAGPVGWGVLAVGVIALGAGALAYSWAQREAAKAAAEQWASNPANGCAGCGWTGGTFGFVLDAAADMCVNPACAPDGEGDPEDTKESSSGSSGGGGDVGGATMDDGSPPNEGSSGAGSWSGGADDDDDDDPCPEGDLGSGTGDGCEGYCSPITSETTCDMCFDGTGAVVWAICSELEDVEPAETQPTTE